MKSSVFFDDQRFATMDVSEAKLGRGADGRLETECKLPRRERRSTQRLFEELRGRGYDGAHDSVHQFHKAWRDERARVGVDDVQRTELAIKGIVGKRWTIERLVGEKQAKPSKGERWRRFKRRRKRARIDDPRQLKLPFDD